MLFLNNLNVMKKNERFAKAVNYLKMIGEIEKNEEVALKMKADASNVSRAITGASGNPTDNFLRRFNAAYNGMFNIDWLIGGNGEMLCVTSGNSIQGSNNNATMSITHNETRNEAGNEKREKRNDLMLTNMLKMLGEFNDKYNYRMERLEKIMEERNRISDRLIDLIEQKDRQIGEIINMKLNQK